MTKLQSLVEARTNPLTHEEMVELVEAGISELLKKADDFGFLHQSGAIRALDYIAEGIRDELKDGA